ncbi:NnrS family protein [Paraburkholderia fungorum]|uniref:NnrS family protein n=1 Tax=Paraburkholderia fungorum TaxID=134537 RepID=UPI002097BD10|nr:NnrS family protein [Paraburkholderia fungorum]USX11125.1 NnrS family protein [Paraburkholderia fungorum]
MKMQLPHRSSFVTPASDLPILRLGFRPFYLNGALFGMLAMLVWLGALHGFVPAGRMTSFNGLLWHTHEMIFGFAAAVVAGFLLTAVRAWTSLETPSGAPLALLWLLWLAGRIAVWFGPEPLAAIVDSAFLPVLMIILLRVLIPARNHHNIFVPVVLGMLGLMNILFHAWVLQGRADLALRSADAAVGLLVTLVTIIAGRVTPMFTANAVPGYVCRRWRAIEALAVPLPLLAFALDALGASPWLVGSAAGATAVVHGIRLAGWRSWKVGCRPILSILHAAYAWVPLGFGMLMLSAVGLVPHSIALHALTVGVLGGAIIAMITRTALGHTGRRLVAGSTEIACYCLVIAAAVLRVFGPLLAGDWGAGWIDAAGLCWCVAFALYARQYWPWLTRPRIDGKAG